MSGIASPARLIALPSFASKTMRNRGVNHSLAGRLAANVRTLSYESVPLHALINAERR